MFIARTKHTNPQWRSYQFPFRLVQKEIVCEQPGMNIKIAEEGRLDDPFCAAEKLNMIFTAMAVMGMNVERVDASNSQLDIKLYDSARDSWKKVEVILYNTFALEIRDCL